MLRYYARKDLIVHGLYASVSVVIQSMLFIGEAIFSRVYVNVRKIYQLLKTVEILDLQILAYSCPKVLGVNVDQSHVYWACTCF